jgi:hypothetical protein
MGDLVPKTHNAILKHVRKEYAKDLKKESTVICMLIVTMDITARKKTHGHMCQNARKLIQTSNNVKRTLNVALQLIAGMCLRLTELKE